MPWIAISDFGDSAVMAPTALVLGLWLGASRAWLGALAWLMLYGAAATIVVCTKIAYIAWGVGVPSLDFTGVSGHAMSAAAVITVAGHMIGGLISRSAALLGGATGLGLGLLVGVSRVVLGHHSPSEAIAGCVLGGLVALAAIGAIRARPEIPAMPAVFVVALVTLGFCMHGHRAPSEQLAVELATRLSGHAGPFVPPAP
ncbi:MAG: phosphatase PAP2 family protein [Roseiarcus sp.]|jgi:membrane-associated phospholipid phosphatase